MGLFSWFKKRPAAASPRVRATYDAARDGTEFREYWANADHLSADGANSRDVRQKLVSRSRYEIGSNGYADGIMQTYATDLVGTGPSLRMQTPNASYNAEVEQQWRLFVEAIQFNRKLWTMAHARAVDGESFGVIRQNPRTGYVLPLDLQIRETEFVQSPDGDRDDIDNIDGIILDEYGNPSGYQMLRYHPGGSTYGNYDYEIIPANRMLHWYKMTRPGQHRGVPQVTSSLNTGAAARRWREATLAAAETAADFTLFLKTQMTPDEFEGVQPLSTLDIQKRMMTALPDGYDAHQMKAEFPTANFSEFTKSLINEQARPMNMPYNKAACDSSSYNYASGRLDHQTYYASLDVDRNDCNSIVLTPLLKTFLEFGGRAFGWPMATTVEGTMHTWDWPKHKVADVLQEAKANQVRIESGQIGLARLYSDGGMDLEDELGTMAGTFGITVDEMRQRILDVVLPGSAPAATAEAPPEPEDENDEDVSAAILERMKLNGIYNNGN